MVKTMPLPSHQLELLSPARDATIAREAILHGADAVYIGGPGFGARHNAGNSLTDIANLVAFAHGYHARVFITLNTILHDDELESAQRLIEQLYDAGVDALIVQDMGILEMDIPPLELHASTQMDIRTVEKARFLSDVGFSQLVLARELNLQQIRAISEQTDAAIEFFVHGALCVAYSGQCYISHAQTGRSANRGDCSQACRLPYTLKDDQGRVVAYEQHLLSLKDNDQTANLRALIDAGVRSFKIEGRYKDMGYVKNITAHYRRQLDAILEERPDMAKASSGATQHFFMPDPKKTFHRGRTDYFVHQRQSDIGAFSSPAFVGLPIGEVSKVDKRHLWVTTREPLHNGDGLNVLIKREVIGFRADIVEPIGEKDDRGWHYRVTPNDLPQAMLDRRLPLALNRNLDHEWQQALMKPSAKRRIAVEWRIESERDRCRLELISEEGVNTAVCLDGPFEPARDPEQGRESLAAILRQLGNTLYVAEAVDFNGAFIPFIPGSQLKKARRQAVDALTAARVAAHPRGRRKPSVMPLPVYPETQLSYLANVYNEKARAFYRRHGVQLIDAAYEAHQEPGDVSVMITKHCLRYSFNLCPKQAKGVTGVRNGVSPMQLVHQGEVLTLRFDCKACEMHVTGRIRPSVFHRPQPGSADDVVASITPEALRNTLRKSIDR